MADAIFFADSDRTTSNTPSVLVFPEFLLVSAQWPSEDVESELSVQKWTFWAPKLWGTDFHGVLVLPLTNNTAKTSVGKNLVKIRPAVAEHSRQRKKPTTRNSS